jgi:uncharacterized membrane protein YfcA
MPPPTLVEQLSWSQQLIILAVVLGVGSFAQGAVGFAAGLMIVPVMLACGWSVAEAQAVLLLATLVQNVWGTVTLRGALRSADLWLPAILRIGWLPVGVGLQWLLSGFSADRIRQVVGLAVMAATLAMILIRPQPKAAVAPIWTWIACSVSGLFQGLCGMGGPALVLWVQSHDWHPDRSRGFLFAQYLISLFPTLLLVGLVFGSEVWRALGLAALLLPVIFLSTFLGMRVGRRLDPTRLRSVSYLLLLLLGLSQVLGPWLY